MPLRPVPLPIQFMGGVETKQDPKSIPLTKLLRVENATFIKQTTLAKRNGYSALARLLEGDVDSYGTPVGLAKRGSELLLFDGERGYSYRPEVDRWSDTGEVASIIATDVPMARTGTQQTTPDHATNGGVTVLAWEDSRGGVWMSNIDSATGRVLLRDTQLSASGAQARCIPCGTMLHVLYTVAASQAIYIAVIDPVSPSSAPTPALLTNDLNSTYPQYDACPVGGGYSTIEPGLIAWNLAGGGYRVGYLAPSGVLGSPVTGLPSVATWTDTSTGPIACAYDRQTGFSVAVVWTAGGLTWVRFLEPNALATKHGTDFQDGSATSAIRAVCEFGVAEASGTEGTLWWAIERSGATSNLNTIACGANTSDGADLESVRTLRGHGLVSRAFYDDGHVYAMVGHAVKFFPYVACVRLSAEDFGGALGTQCFARAVPGEFPGLSSHGHVTSAHSVDPDSDLISRQHAVCVGKRLQLSSTNGDQFAEAGIRLVTLDFDADTSYQSAELGRSLYLAGACAQNYDGTRWAEADFHCAPDVALGAAAIGAQAGVGSMANGTYGYKLCYEEVNAQGEILQGAVGASFNVVVAAGGGTAAVTFALPTYRLSNKRHTRIGVFRSAAGATGDPDSIPYYRVTDVDPSNATGNNRYVLNDATVDTVTFIDGLSDANLILREGLYTNGGILSNDPTTMAGECIAGGKSRLFWTAQEDPHLVRYSKTLADELALEQSADLFLRCDPYGGDVVAIGVMDDAVYPFTETAVYMFGGPGPDADGGFASENAFSAAQLLTSDVGCKSPASVCQSPVGITFQSSKGIMLLGRDRQVIDIGSDVYAYNDQTIVRATLLPDRHQIVFLTDAGLTLLWDYERKAWGVFTNHEGYDATVIDGTYYYLRTDGRVFQETPGEYADDNVPIVMKIETAWIKAGGYLQGWQSILWAHILGTYKSEHTLRMRYRLDYEEGYSAPFDMDVNSNFNPSLYGDGPYGAGAYGGAGGATTVYQRSKHLNRKCQAISFLFEDVEATGDFGASFELSELLLIGGVMGDSFKAGPARRT